MSYLKRICYKCNKLFSVNFKFAFDKEYCYTCEPVRIYNVKIIIEV